MRTSVTLDKLACYRIRQTCCDCHPPPWEPSTPPSNANATEWAIAQALEVTSPASVRDNGSDDDDHNNNGDDDNGDNDDSSGDDDDDNGIVGPTTGAVAVAASRRIITIPRVEGASQVVQNAELDKNGRSTIPPSLSTAQNYMKSGHGRLFGYTCRRKQGHYY
ncbi:hypothetical protein BC939DRAFT_263852 [Gamsiella multidivaricata]|uniref:uncharacterized protein n=1 Tax=Gamsiella multidivaricata TaxID=101098 RepID=UPI00221EA5DC|nr:uncharacterized protein BC939DRAFT_263852 [Gamsiella multidivaricata]KAI7819401.1 hypothetical protein BC939DRAFT_263852 [Gamsiella multidivaricata]